MRSEPIMLFHLGRTLQEAIAPQIDIEAEALEGCLKIMYKCLKPNPKEPVMTLVQDCTRPGCTFSDGLKVSRQHKNNEIKIII